MIPSPPELIFMLIVEFLIAISICLIPIGIIAGIVFAFLRRSPENVSKKGLYTKIMIWSFVGPIGALVFILIIWGLVFVLL